MGSSGDDPGPSDGGSGIAIPVPGVRIGNSSSAVIDALADPGFRIGNSSSSGLLGIGIGAEIVPRIDLCRVLARPAVEPGFPKMLGMLMVRTGGRLVVYGRQSFGGTGSRAGEGGQRWLIRLPATPSHLRTANHQPNQVHRAAVLPLMQFAWVIPAESKTQVKPPSTSHPYKFRMASDAAPLPVSGARWFLWERRWC